MKERAGARMVVVTLAAALAGAWALSSCRSRSTRLSAEGSVAEQIAVGEYTFGDIARLSRLKPVLPQLLEHTPVENPGLTARLHALPLAIDRAWNQVPSLWGVWQSHDRKDILGFTRQTDFFLMDKATLVLRWSQHIEKPLHPDIWPVSSDNHVYLMTVDNELWCFNRQRGDLRWRRLVRPWLPRTPMAANDDFVYFGTYEKEGMVAFSVRHEGFSNHFNNSLNPIHIDTAPLAEPDAVYFSGGNDEMYGLEADCSTERWSRSVEKAPDFDPTFGEANLYVAGADQTLYCFSRAGQRLWSWRSNGRMASPAWESGDYVFVSTEELTAGALVRYFVCIKRRWVDIGNRQVTEMVWDPQPEESALARKLGSDWKRDPENTSWRAMVNTEFLACGKEWVYTLTSDRRFLIRLNLKDGSFDQNTDVFPVDDLAFLVRDATRDPLEIIVATQDGYIHKLHE